MKYSTTFWSVAAVKIVAIIGLTVCAIHFERWWIVLFALLIVPALSDIVDAGKSKDIE